MIINLNPEEFETKAAYDEAYKDKVRLLAICYHNMSVEESYFANNDKSLDYAKKAFQLMKGKFGEQNHFTKKFKANYYDKLNNEPLEPQAYAMLRPVSETTNSRIFKIAAKDKDRQKVADWKIRPNPLMKPAVTEADRRQLERDNGDPYHQSSLLLEKSKRPITKINPLTPTQHGSTMFRLDHTKYTSFGRLGSPDAPPPSSLAIPASTTNIGPHHDLNCPYGTNRSHRPQHSHKSSNFLIKKTGGSQRSLKKPTIEYQQDEQSRSHSDEENQAQIKQNVYHFHEDLMNKTDPGYKARMENAQRELERLEAEERDRRAQLKEMQRLEKDDAMKKAVEKEQKEKMNKLARLTQEISAVKLMGRFARCSMLISKQIKNSRLSVTPRQG